MSFIETYDVVGMTCDHCVRSVATEVGAVDGVTDVRVDLPTGKVHVSAEREVPVAKLREAVEEAGYALA
jgi:copper ion binding protein